MDEDIRYLNIVAIFHLILGVVTGLVSCLALINLAMGLSMLPDIPKTIAEGDGMAPFAILPLMFIVIPVGITVIGWMFAIAIALNGYYIHKREWLTYCLVMGGVETIFIPFGTVLGVFTIILLTKPNIKKRFDHDK